MTIPDTGKVGQGDRSAGPERVDRPKLTDAERKHVYRGGQGAPNPKGPAKLGPGVAETARVVQLAYSVIGDNIKQGREVAEKLRQGQYHISAAPADLETAGRRVLSLARELSSTTLDFGERLLGEMRGVMGPVERFEGVPPFRALVGKAVLASNRMADTVRWSLTVQFDDGVNAKAHTSFLERPKTETQIDRLEVTALVRRPGGEELDGEVSFNFDLASGNLIAKVTMRPLQKSGVYTGLVCVRDADVPLGALTIEIPQTGLPETAVPETGASK